MEAVVCLPCGEIHAVCCGKCMNRNKFIPPVYQLRYNRCTGLYSRLMDIVHQDNVSRAYVVEDSADVRLDIFRLPVQGIDIPHDAGTTDLREQIVGAVSIGKTATVAP